jgi:hypothetical protein
MSFLWSKETYEQSLSSRCWWFTPYDGGQWSDAVQADEGLRQIVEMEAALGNVPPWAQQVVERSIRSTCPCGHYLFPQPYLEVLDAIGVQAVPDFVHSCFTVARPRKRQAQDYAFCLDAWLAGASFEAPARELAALGYRQIDWHATCAALWHVLGERTEVKELLVARMLHSLRWSIKFTFWDNDPASTFGRDQYLGDYARVDDVAGAASIDGYYERPTFCYEQASPRVQRMEARLAELLPDWAAWRGQLAEWWLCAPKSFRFLERILWAIGQRHPLQPNDRVPGFLRCEDTYPDQAEVTRWWAAFCAALDGWWRAQPASSEVSADVQKRLGAPTPVKRWLVRLFVYKLVCLEENGAQLANLVRADHNHRRGTQPLRPPDRESI